MFAITRAAAQRRCRREHRRARRAGRPALLWGLWGLWGLGPCAPVALLRRAGLVLRGNNRQVDRADRNLYVVCHRVTSRPQRTGPWTIVTGCPPDGAHWTSQ